MPDHVHMLLSIPPKYAVSQVVGYIKGKSAIHHGSGLWRAQTQFRRTALLGPRVFFVNTVGRDEEVIRDYIRNQEKEDQRLEQMKLVAKKRHLQVAAKSRGRVSDPSYRFERLTPLKPPALPGDTYIGTLGSPGNDGPTGRERDDCGVLPAYRLRRLTRL